MFDPRTTKFILRVVQNERNQTEWRLWDSLSGWRRATPEENLRIAAYFASDSEHEHKYKVKMGGRLVCLCGEWKYVTESIGFSVGFHPAHGEWTIFGRRATVETPREEKEPVYFLSPEDDEDSMVLVARPSFFVKKPYDCPRMYVPNLPYFERRNGYMDLVAYMRTLKVVR